MAVERAPARPEPLGNILERGLKAAARSPLGRVVAVGTIAFGADACAVQQTPTFAGGDQITRPTAETARPRETATPIGIGATIEKFGIPEIDIIGEKLATHQPVSEADILKWNAAVEKRANATATALAEKPTIKPKQIGESEIPDYLNTLNTTVQAMPNVQVLPLPGGTLPEYAIPQNKTELQNAVTAATEALKKGDKQTALRQIVTINLELVAIGGKTVFIPPDTINQIDKDHIYMQAIARGPADPKLMEAYLTNAKITSC